MKKQFILLSIALTAIVVSFSACKKDSSQDINYTTLESAQKNARSALTLSQSYNDTLIMVYDTAHIHKGNRFCLMYDSLYHHSDSMFSMHYRLFGDEMYRNGVMMPGYNSGGMMGGGMMGGGMMDTSRWHQDTSMMNGYYRTMQQLHVTHQPYHSEIHD